MNTKDRILRRLLPFLLISVILSQPVISGYIKLDTYHDSHAVTAAREGHYALYPENSDPASRINFVLFQSRIRVSLPSQPFFTWSVAGFIEGDFFGTSNGRENQFRLRHSVITITNPTTRITLGQYWSPLFNEYVYPGTVSFNTGAPMQPFARMPQITVTKQVMSSFFLRLSATMQRDAFADIGGVEQQQASGRPGFHLHGWFQTPRFLLGTGLYQKSIQPEDAPSFPALAGTFYGKLSLDRFHIKWKYTRGEDLADHIMLGGYAILTDTLSGSMRSVPLSSENLWLDCESHVGAWRVGLFFGQVDNLGTGQALNENETAHLMARGTTIKRIARLAPRVSYLQNKFRLAYELEITRADYFSNLNLWFIPSGEKTDRINIRNLIAFYLFF